ncbi:MAG: hypothetical protein WB869_03010 [Candidatus Acidiferrales bacterium]
MSELRVQCHCGYRADQRPVRFTLRGREFQVNDIDGEWYTPEAKYFRVIAQDGNFYVLRHDEVQDSWTLDAFRASREFRSSQRAAESESKPTTSQSAKDGMKQ